MKAYQSVTIAVEKEDILNLSEILASLSEMVRASQEAGYDPSKMTVTVEPTSRKQDGKSFPMIAISMAVLMRTKSVDHEVFLESLQSPALPGEGKEPESEADIPF